MSNMVLARALTIGAVLWTGTALAQDCPDADSDGFFDEACGGRDCDDTDAAINPDATDIAGDGIDQDCDHVDRTEACDQDGDGFDALACGGDDCNDLDATVNPGAEEVGGDGIDQDCDSLDSCEPVRWVQGGRSCTVAGGGLGVAWLPLLGVLALRRRRSSC